MGLIQNGVLSAQYVIWKQNQFIYVINKDNKFWFT